MCDTCAYVLYIHVHYSNEQYQSTQIHESEGYRCSVAATVHCTGNILGLDLMSASVWKRNRRRRGGVASCICGRAEGEVAEISPSYTSTESTAGSM